MIVSESDFDNLMGFAGSKPIYENNGIRIGERLYKSQEDAVKSIDLSFLVKPNADEARINAINDHDTERARAIATFQILQKYSF